MNKNKGGKLHQGLIESKIVFWESLLEKQSQEPKVLRGRIIVEDSTHIHILRRDGIFRISKDLIAKIETLGINGERRVESDDDGKEGPPDNRRERGSG